MKKIILSLLMISVLMVSIGFVFAKQAKTEISFDGLKNEGQANQLYLYEKDSSDWSIIDGGAWGKMTYTDAKFVFNGHGLVAGTDYTLISYKEPWNGCGSAILGNAEANNDGNVHIMGAMSEVVINDYPYEFGGDYEGVSGAKIWLVPTADMAEDCFNAWNPNEYLFENNLIYETLYEYTLLNLFSKNPSDWSVIDGAYGKVHYDTDDFKFWGYDLAPSTSYTLLTYGGWSNIACFETGISDVDGNMDLVGGYSFALKSDDVAIPVKIWLVKASDVSCGTEGMTAWNPTSYLFEEN